MLRQKRRRPAPSFHYLDEHELVRRSCPSCFAFLSSTCPCPSHAWSSTSFSPHSVSIPLLTVPCLSYDPPCCSILLLLLTPCYICCCFPPLCNTAVIPMLLSPVHGRGETHVPGVVGAFTGCVLPHPLPPAGAPGAGHVPTRHPQLRAGVSSFLLPQHCVFFFVAAVASTVWIDCLQSFSHVHDYPVICWCHHISCLRSLKWTRNAHHL